MLRSRIGFFKGLGSFVTRQGFLMALLASLGSAASSGALANFTHIAYDLEGAKQAGNLCEEPLQISAAGNQLMIRWSGARLALSQADENFARGRCLVRVPAIIPKGYRIAQLTARAQSWTGKPRGVSANLNLAVVLSALQPLETETIISADTAWHAQANVYKSFDGLEPLTTAWRDELCSPTRTSDVMVGINLGAALQREYAGSSGSSVVDFSGQDRGVDIWAELLPCSR